MNRRYKSLLILLPAFFLSHLSAQAPEHKVLACVGGKLYPSPVATPIEDAAVVVEDGKISAVAPGVAFKLPAAAEVLDCKGKAIVAGFWNSHVHFETGWHGAEDAPADKLEAHMQEILTR
jgi:imidazolonepropionase-like amidohydrolase